jgi:hypothetical protein
MDAIIADALNRSGADASAVTVARAESVIWNDGALGCPEPGVMYTQALVEGYWVVLDVSGQPYDYRASEQGAFKLCVDSQGVPPTPPES